MTDDQPEEKATHGLEIEKTLATDSVRANPESSKDSEPAFDETRIDSSAESTGNIEHDITAGDSSLSGILSGQFGRYRIISTLGEGAMGSVLLAMDTQLNRKIALKIPKLNAGNSEKFLKRFYREAQSAATLSHPNICQVHDVGELDGQHYIAMAYIEGHSLSQFIRSGKKLPQRSCALICKKIASALVEAHAQGIVHRDLKPANIMINKRNEPVVMDFGLAHQLSDDEAGRLTQDGALLGSPAYMSPEQVSGKPDDVGPASDVYGLGVVLYEMLSGTVPFAGVGTITSIVAEILTKDPPEIAELRGDLSPELAKICMKAMAKDPSKRYKSMQELADALSSYLKQESSGSGNPPGQKVLPKLNQSDAESAKLQDKTDLVHSFCAEGQHTAAVTILEKMIAENPDSDSRYIQWAKRQLPRIQEFIENEEALKAAQEEAQYADPFAVTPPSQQAHKKTFPPTPLRPAFAQTAKTKADSGIPGWVWWLIPIPIAAILIAVIAIILTSVLNRDTETTKSTVQTDSNTPIEADDKQSSSAPDNRLPGMKGLLKQERRDAKTGGGEKAGKRFGPGGEAREDSSTAVGSDARPNPGEDDRPPDMKRPSDAFADLDFNRDDYLDESEIPEDHLSRMMEGDANDDRRISMEELTMMHRKRKQPDDKPLPRLMTHDENGDGELSRVEIPFPIRPMFDEADTNGDGILDRQEIDKLDEKLRELGPLKRPGSRGERPRDQRE